MQNLPLKLSATNPATVLQVAGNGFWYESAAGSPELRIIITPEYGSDLVLRPGQSVRLPKNIGTWTLRSYDSSATINGNIIIGSGEFSDNNTTVANISGSVTVSNEIEVKNDSGNPLPISGTVSIANELEVKNDSGNPLNVIWQGYGQVQENLLIANKSYFSNTGLPSIGGGICGDLLVSSAQNTSGVTIHNFDVFGTGTNTEITLIATNAEPTSISDGQVIMYLPASLSAGSVRSLAAKIKVPAGKNIYVVSMGSVACTRYANMTV